MKDCRFEVQQEIDQLELEPSLDNEIDSTEVQLRYEMFVFFIVLFCKLSSKV